MKRAVWTRRQAVARYSKGFGQGEGASYRPWLEPKDFSSKGVSRRVPGRFIGRNHSLFSNHEWRAFLACQHLRDVVDIREQYPLWKLEETETIAKSLNFRHPAPLGAEPQVMTTDLVLTMSDGSIAAIAVKPARDLDKARVLEKLEIERRYWEAREVTWSIVTEREIGADLFANLQAISGCYWIPVETLPADLVAAIETDLLGLLVTQPHQPFGTHCHTIDDRHGVEPGSSFTVAKHALACRRWEVRLDIPIDGKKALALKSPSVSAAMDDPDEGAAGTTAAEVSRP